MRALVLFFIILKVLQDDDGFVVFCGVSRSKEIIKFVMRWLTCNPLFWNKKKKIMLHDWKAARKIRKYCPMHISLNEVINGGSQVKDASNATSMHPFQNDLTRLE